MKKTNEMEHILAKSFSGNLSENERELLTQWLNEDSQHSQQYVQQMSIWHACRPPFDPGYIEVGKAHNQIMKKIGGKRSAQSLFILWWQRVAAIVLLPLGLLTMYFLLDHRNVSDPVVWQEITAPYGTTSQIELPDGSTVWLNTGSRLRYPTAFQDKKRSVTLAGEGFFEVHSDKLHPFIVETNGMQITATGTKFNVEAYPSDSMAAVTLMEGKVDVRFENQTQTALKHNQRVTYNVQTKKYNLFNTEAQRWALWKEGKLVFRDESLEEVFKRIGRAYNVEIAVKDHSIANQTYRATFDGESLEEILRLLKLTAPLKYTRSGKIKLDDGSYTKEKIEVYKSTLLAR